MESKKHTLLTVYLWLVSLASFIWLCISVIIFVYQILYTNVITDEEYISQNHRKIDRCEDPVYMKNESIEKTEEEKNECIEKAKTQLILERKVNTKETLLLSWLRFFVLMIIFTLHFRYFRKNNK